MLDNSFRRSLVTKTFFYFIPMRTFNCCIKFFLVASIKGNQPPSVENLFNGEPVFVDILFRRSLIDIFGIFFLFLSLIHSLLYQLVRIP